MTDPNRIARRYMKAVGEPVKETVGAPAKRQVTPARLVDLMAFSLAYDAFITVMAEAQKDPGDIGGKGLLFVRRFMPEMAQGILQHIAPVLDNPTAVTLKPAFQRAVRPGAPATQIHIVAHFFSVLMPWMKIHTPVIQGAFPGRSGMAARSLATACQEKSSASRLNKIATIAPVSGLATLRKWAEEAASVAGVPLQPIEGALADAAQAKGLGEDLKTVESKITASDPNAP